MIYNKIYLVYIYIYIGLYYPPIMENQMEKKIENDMETGGI